MNFRFLLLFCLFSISSVEKTKAQGLPQASIGKFVKVGDEVEIPVEAATPFYVGNSRFCLHIGTHALYQYRQVNTEENRGRLIFLLTENEFKKLHDGAKMFLTYGDVFDMDKPVDEGTIARLPNISQYLGVFSKTALAK